MSKLNLEMNCSYIHPIPEAKGTRGKNNIKCGQVEKALWWDVLSGDAIQEEGAKSSRAHTRLNQKCFHWCPLGLVCRAWIWGKQLDASLNAWSQHLLEMYFFPVKNSCSHSLAWIVFWKAWCQCETVVLAGEMFRLPCDWGAVQIITLNISLT